MKLYHHPASNNCRMVLATLHHLGSKPEMELVDLARGGNRKPEFLAINPNGKVPVLVDGDFTLWESNAIAQYLCDLTPGQTLYPANPRSRADINRWQFWQQAHLGRWAGALTFERMLKPLLQPGATPDPRKTEEAEGFFKRFAGVLNRHLEGRDWIVGRHPTLADFSVGSMLMHSGPAQLPLDGFAYIRNWYARLSDWPAWKATEATM